MGSSDISLSYKLKNIVAIIDKNNFQQTGSSSEIMNTADLASNGEALTGMYLEIDGHDIQQLYDTFSSFKKLKKTLQPLLQIL